MSEMKFKFTEQDYQTEAVESVVDVFTGQPFNSRFTYRRDANISRDIINFDTPDEELYIGFANACVELEPSQILKNIRAVQTRNNIRLSDSLIGDLGVCSLDVEMETGTGKTYVYIKTMFELNRRYGWSKFIVVVPGIAIREGVHKSFDTMQDHFMEKYGKKARFFVYDSKKLAEIDAFSQSADINVMIINIQAFNANFEESRKTVASKIIHEERDSFGSRRPMDVLAANRPIILLDEPQKMGGQATQTGLKKFNPLFCLNYSATHKTRHNLVYVLDALDAYNKKLVKRIEVKGFDIRNLGGANRYLFLERIVLSPNHPPKARLEFEIGPAPIRRVTRLVGRDDDLFDLSNHLEQYRGFGVSDIDPMDGSLSFTNGQTLCVGEVTGNNIEATLRRVQIQETIRSHFEKEKELFAKGIKVLSLFFIDAVAKYRQYDAEGNEVNGEYGQFFEEEYCAVLNDYLRDLPLNAEYATYLRGITAQSTHAGYFSIDKKGRKVDSAIKRGSEESDDISAYDLILKDKERLLSLENPVRFIFSHSALREGWDNPNVFQICTLKHGGASTTQKRQEVGRGLRLCVNQSGDRMDRNALGDQVQKLNQLTVIASDGYKDFVANLQAEIRDVLYERPFRASKEYFAGKTVLRSNDGGTARVSEEQARHMYQYLVKNNYIDENDRVTDQYRVALENGALEPVPPSCSEIAEGLHNLVQSIFDERALDAMIEDGRKTKIQKNPLNEKFYKKEFQELWQLISGKYAYTVSFDSEELIKKAIAYLNKNMFVTELQYTVTSGEQREKWDAETLKSGAGFGEEKSATRALEREDSNVKYDLVGKIAEGAKLIRRTAARILAGIHPSTFDKFRQNPEEFIARAIRLINEQKASTVVECITYNRIEDSYDSAIFTEEWSGDFSRAYKAKKNVQPYVLTDSNTEKAFAKDMDAASEVCVYAKLPRGFAIPTPLGHYSPDWAIAFNKSMVKHIFFIAETKGSMESLSLRAVEQAKIKCAKKLFGKLSTKNLKYGVVNSYAELMNILK